MPRTRSSVPNLSDVTRKHIAVNVIHPGSFPGSVNNLTPETIKSLHDVADIANGRENVAITLVNEVNDECPPSFHYIRKSLVFENAYVNFPLSRIGDQSCCSSCSGDCLSASKPCACALESGGEFAYTPDGLIKEEFLEECISMTRDPKKHCQFFCKECPLERSKGADNIEPCKGHLIRKFIKECWSKCSCHTRCGNRVIQRGISYNLQVFMTSEEKGWGLRSLVDLPKGAFVCEYAGEILTNSELYDRGLRRPKGERHTYPMLLDADWGAEGYLKDDEALCLDASYYGNVGRFINHRCGDSNLVDIPVEVETSDHHIYHVAFFTTRKVKAMEELTWDYGIDFDNHDHPIKVFPCQCGSKFCDNIMRSIGEMAPRVLSTKPKPRYVANHTSLNVQPPNSTTRRSSAKLEQDVVNDSTPIVNTPVQPKVATKVSRPKPPVPKTQSTSGQTNSTIRQINATTPQTKSTILQTQSSSPQTRSPLSQSQSNVPQSQANENETTGPQPQSTDNSEDEEDPETLSTKRTGIRGPTVGRGLMKGLGGSSAKKMKIDVDPLIGRPKNRVQSAKFSSQIGVVARDVLPPVRKWKELNVEIALEPCMDHLQIHLDVEMKKAGVKECVIDRLKGSARQQRYRQHKHYLKYLTMEEAKKHPPQHLSGKQDQWNLLCEFFNSPEFKNRSRANTNNRKKVRAPHVTGRTPFSIIQNEFSGKDGQVCDNFELYLKTHKNDKGWSTEDAELNWEMMIANEAQYDEEGTEMTEQEVVTEVLGKANGYVKGYGYGLKPPGKKQK